LQRSLDAEVADRSALEAVVTSPCEGLGVSASGSSLRSRVDALYSRLEERLREALHDGVKKALAVVSSHYVGIHLRQSVRAMSSLKMRWRPRRRCKNLNTLRMPQEMLWLPSSMPRWSFPCLSAQGPAQAGQ